MKNGVAYHHSFPFTLNRDPLIFGQAGSAGIFIFDRLLLFFFIRIVQVGASGWLGRGRQGRLRRCDEPIAALVPRGRLRPAGLGRPVQSATGDATVAAAAARGVVAPRCRRWRRRHRPTGHQNRIRAQPVLGVATGLRSDRTQPSHDADTADALSPAGVGP